MIVIKVGGNAIHSLSANFYDKVQDWVAEGEQVIVIHGGGQLITAACDFFALPTVKDQGIRVTPKPVMALTNQVLTQVVQAQFASLFSAHKIPVYPVNQEVGPLFIGDYLDQEQYGQVGAVMALNPAVVSSLPSGKVWLVNSVAQTVTGDLLNVNADAAAQALASLVGADELILLTDVPGVLVNGQVLNQLDAGQIADLVAHEQITGG
ncbi:acetylglutamate kinase, partial [Fructobacillus ficulneus]